MRRALITGITGQDGSYLTELLLARNYEVHGVIRRSSTFNTDRIDHLYEDPHAHGKRLILYYGDLTDGMVLRRILESAQPDEVYNLGAQSHVMVSFQEPEYTLDSITLGTLRLLESVRDYCSRTGREVRIYQAGSSEMFGSAPPPQNELTPFHPRSPYGAAKAAAHMLAVNYREAYGLYVCNGILFNHESPRRGETFVTRKITRAVGRISEGLQDAVYLGNLDARRDWGYAGDFVEAMWQMLQQPSADDYVIATGTSFTVREFAEAAFECAGLDWSRFVRFDARYVRPAEVDHLCGDASKAQHQLDWQPKVSLGELVRMMVDADTDLARQERTLQNAGHVLSQRGAAAV